ncbi:MAG: hypothetical protein LBH20_02065 [Treponema sp.]|jgi:hypothetical protein|nr:hypothetical protein [Treponema sp.]
MKKHLIFLLMITAAVSGFAADQDVAVYEIHYNAALSYASQLVILQDMAKTQPSDANEFYTKALRKLVAEYSNIKDDNEKKAADEQAIILAAQLGAGKHAPAASDLWQVANRFEAAMARAEAMMALGNIPAPAYIPQIIRVLESMNVKPTPNRLYGERIANGAIIALERYQDPSGYLPVFFASIGWYAPIVREQATKSLAIIAQDPSSYMMDVVKKSSYNHYAKFAALKNTEAAAIDNKKKVEIAVEALNQGWRSNNRNEEIKITLAEMRKLAINMINRYKSDNQAIYQLLERSCTQGGLDEKFSAIATLASQGTEESSKRLSKLLVDLNNKRLRNNIDQEDEQLVRAVIPALGQLGLAQSRSALSAVGASNWPPAVVKLADEALDQLKR